MSLILGGFLIDGTAIDLRGVRLGVTGGELPPFNSDILLLTKSLVAKKPPLEDKNWRSRALLAKDSHPYNRCDMLCKIKGK